MQNYTKYRKGYYLPPVLDLSWAKKEYPDHAPVWCSVDLRDGNQSLIIPMSLDEKIEFYKMLVKIGFKEIEVGFPSASETEYEILRALIERDLIPESLLRRVVTTGYIGDDLVEILGGVTENDLVIAGGQNKLREGSKVKVVDRLDEEGNK